MKRVFIIHGWGGNPEEIWFPWLKGQLEARGFLVTAPALPDTDEPGIDAWVGAVEAAVGTPDEDTYFVGHSLGCQTIMRYLAIPDRKVGGAVFVAGCFSITGLTPDERMTIKPWEDTPIVFSSVRENLPRSIAIFSDNDPFVPLDENVRGFTTALHPEIIIEKGRGHYNAGSGTYELPSALEAILKMAA